MIFSQCLELSALLGGAMQLLLDDNSCVIFYWFIPVLRFRTDSFSRILQNTTNQSVKSVLEVFYCDNVSGSLHLTLPGCLKIVEDS